MSDDEKPDYGALYYVIGCALVVGAVFGWMAFRDWRAYEAGDGELRNAWIVGSPPMLVASERAISGYDEGDPVHVYRLSTYDLATGALTKRSHSEISDCRHASGTRLWCRDRNDTVLIDGLTHAPVVTSSQFPSRYQLLRSGFDATRSYLDVGEDGALAVVSNAGVHVLISGDGLSATQGEHRQLPPRKTTSSYVTSDHRSFCAVPASELRVPCINEQRLPVKGAGLLHPTWIDTAAHRLVLFGDHLDEAKAGMTLLSYDPAWELAVGPYADVRNVAFDGSRLIISFAEPNSTTRVIDLSGGQTVRVVKH